MKILRTGTPEFGEQVQALRERRWRLIDELAEEVDDTISVYRKEREKALLRWAGEYDGVQLKESDLWVDPEWIRSSHKKVSSEVRKAIDHAKERIERFQEELRINSFRAHDEAGVFWGTEVRPIDRLGVYVPGGRVNYFMTLLLCAIPARAAGVKEIVVASPPKKHLDRPFIDFALLYCAKVLKIEQIILAGSVGALSALTFGTSKTKPAQKIVGSGGLRSSVAKLRLAGYVGIDSLSGPLETAFICDQSSQIKSVAADIIGRADHDPQAEIMVFHSDATWLESLVDELANSVQGLKAQEEQSSIRQCLDTRTLFFKVKNIKEAIEITNEISPAVVCLVTDQASDMVSDIRSCGSVLMGHFTPPVGLDLVGAPSGLVNTLGTAEFSLSMSPLSYIRRFTVMEFDQLALERHESESLKLAKEEGLHTHEASFRARKSST